MRLWTNVGFSGGQNVKYNRWTRHAQWQVNFERYECGWWLKLYQVSLLYSEDATKLEWTLECHKSVNHQTTFVIYALLDKGNNKTGFESGQMPSIKRFLVLEIHIFWIYFSSWIAVDCIKNSIRRRGFNLFKPTHGSTRGKLIDSIFGTNNTKNMKQTFWIYERE